MWKKFQQNMSNKVEVSTKKVPTKRVPVKVEGFRISKVPTKRFQSRMIQAQGTTFLLCLVASQIDVS